ncbi:MAG: hypothetical protein UY85_C0032G0002 [Candidatus Peribacteria bacterium GW2011_GWB1_54_5]|nr:MAG: hypothetical protein UY85_C0032G0002 [Candidatus Peribacteria bacterium GW2011_GWB1_54_5]
MGRLRALVNQDYSARSRSRAAGLTHGAQADVLVTVGVTPEGVGDGGEVAMPRVLVAHFCSSRLAVRRLIVPGDGQNLSDCTPVMLPHGLPRITSAAIVRLPMRFRSNGSISFQRLPGRMIFVPVPRELAEDAAPWCYEGGAEDVAEYLVGERDLDLMFRRYGQLVEC